MNRLFAKDFWYNWTPNPVNPGLGDFAVFLVRNLVFGLLFCSPFVAVGHGSVGMLFWSAASEEQVRITWMASARMPLKAGFFFAASVASVEFLLVAVPARAFKSLEAFGSVLLTEILPATVHLSLTAIGYLLLSRHVSAPRTWVVCAAAHGIYNLGVFGLTPG